MSRHDDHEGSRLSLFSSCVYDFWSPHRDHLRQRRTIHIQNMASIMSTRWYLRRSHSCILSLDEWSSGKNQPNHGEFVEMLDRCHVDKYSKWTDYLPLLEHELNSMSQSTNIFMPNELRYVISPRNIRDIFNASDDKVTSIEELMDDLKNKWDEVRSIIRLA